MINEKDVTLVKVVRERLYGGDTWIQTLMLKRFSHMDDSKNDSRTGNANITECSYSDQCLEGASAVKILSNSLSKHTESNLASSVFQENTSSGYDIKKTTTVIIKLYPWRWHYDTALTNRLSKAANWMGFPRRLLFFWLCPLCSFALYSIRQIAKASASMKWGTWKKIEKYQYSGYCWAEKSSQVVPDLHISLCVNRYTFI